MQQSVVSVRHVIAPAVGGAGGGGWLLLGASKQKTENTKHTSQENDTMLERVLEAVNSWRVGLGR